MSKEIDNIESLINKNNMQFRNFKLTNIETRKNDDNSESLVLEGIPCVFDKETVLYKGKYYEAREKIDKDAFTDADTSDVIFNFNHSGRVFARTRNDSLSLEVKEDGLHMRACLNKNDRGHKELYNDIQSGLIDKMSFAFTVAESKTEYISQNDEDYEIALRTVTKIGKLYDVSAVDIPAYDETSISARKSFDTELEEKEKRSLELARARYFYL